MSEASKTAQTIVAGCLEYGIRDFVLCPGSRSAPLAYALQSAEAAGLIRLYVETDERVAGFVALGLGKAGNTAAVITTSGSAVANLHPAVEEAAYAGVPLLILSADRPHELRGVRASQTTDHIGVLRASVRAAYDIPTDYGSCTALQGLIHRAIRAAQGRGFTGGGPGPVHVNIAFREPLFAETVWQTDSLVKRYGRVSASGADSFADSCADGGTEHSTSQLAATAKRTVVVAGSGDRLPELRTYGGDTSRFLQSDFAASFAGIPVLAEPATVLRGLPTAIGAHPILLAASLPLRALIERVVVIGHPTLTREVSALLADPAVEVIVVDEPPTYTDVSGNAARIIDATELGAYLETDLSWLSLWLSAARRAEHALEQWERSADTLDFPRLARAVNRDAGRIRTLLAASSIVREVNLYTPAPGPVYEANRGLAGIDGTVSTAIGMSLASQMPVRVVLGDLAFIHDLGALVATAGQTRGNVQVVIADDGGGSLFSTLEYGKGSAEAFDRVFRTEKMLDMENFVASLGRHVRYVDVSGSAERCAQVLADYAGGIEVVYAALQREPLSTMREHRARLRTRVLSVLTRDN
ncbi:MAG: 2-succinyl-5-enolpyruvyl-6-hydroxy-3-cyclohexene-1-carboxylic-acid synthase [Arcanobacterium sp.]|nr:2-succinyl-5-enolpyruvyl-6-hydroxy-3-cyclohexene-1-carboxylic-acid synthase [Arcanobacterium sp.]